MSILVIAEQANGTLRKSTLCAITAARDLSGALGLDWNIAVLGSNVGGVASELASYGASQVVVADDSSLSHYLAMPYAAAASTIASSSAQLASHAIASTGVPLDTTSREFFAKEEAIRQSLGLPPRKGFGAATLNACQADA